MKRWAITFVSLLCLAAPLTMGFSRQIVHVRPISVAEMSPAEMAAALPHRIKAAGAEIPLRWQGGEVTPAEATSYVAFTATIDPGDLVLLKQAAEQVGEFLFNHAASLASIYGSKQPVLVQVVAEATGPKEALLIWQYSHTPGQEATYGFVEPAAE